ncbi:ribosome maturation factor RimM [Marinigracilibium pacificum]|uniref:Ribosome maturation factor RimM n=1 Tax=Marinigracilibium pacificum TaxID=2729599 RepID=A0A848IYQ2_9BACT|nr:ribosome maturation factor RimM [Marinigracilibium pacificum]NMM49653.1 16S rRNA processing protein RimM [Marinigracilibium pacificum]
MDINSCFQLGYITRLHGVKGELQIFIDSDNPEEYSEMESVFVEKGGQLVPFFIESLVIKGKKGIIAFEDVETLEEAEQLKGAALFLPLEALPKLTGDQFYYHEVVGYKVVDETHGELGLVDHIINHPGQDLIAMDFKGTEILIPINDVILKGLDRDEKILKVDLPDGLLDIYLES